MKPGLSIIAVLLAAILATPQVEAKTKAKTDDQAFGALKHLEVYNAILRELEINYVDTLKHEKLLKASADRLLYTLDPYTVYIPASEQETVKRLKSGEYGGIGSLIQQVDGKPYIYETFSGMPAERNGLKAGDEIIEIDGEKCSGKKVGEVSAMLRGKPQSTIKIKVRRLGEKHPIEKTFQRRIVKTETVPYWGEVADGVGYVMIEDFIDRTAADFKHAVNELVEEHHIDRLIIDLRGNGGGLVDQAVDIASLFVPKGTEIVHMRGRHKQNEYSYVTRVEPLYPDMKLLFMVDENTASSAEILSGAMQDLDRGIVYGQQTFGKGLVQNIRQLPYDSYLKVTTAKYYLPSGRCIQAVDYASRQNNIREREIPDSLINEFYTAGGRVVFDGSGIRPDSLYRSEENFNVADYMFMKNIYFKYANEFVTKHASIDAPSVFTLTDDEYADFCDFVKESGFTYRLESEKYLQDLKEMVKVEGYDELTQDLFEQLTAKLQPDVEDDLTRFEEDIRLRLETEIVKRYHHRRGAVEYSLRFDPSLPIAIELSGKQLSEME